MDPLSIATVAMIKFARTLKDVGLDLDQILRELGSLEKI